MRTTATSASAAATRAMVERYRAATRGTPGLTLTVQSAVDDDDLPRRATLRRWMLAALTRDARVTVRFVGAREGRALNLRYRGRDYPTNVLTFVYDDVAPLTGDLVLCVPVVRREAHEQGKSFRAHCAHLVIHGMLHLQGFDHERDAEARRMEAREVRALAALGYRDPYRETAAP
jgi:probable rRNA maturation factor